MNGSSSGKSIIYFTAAGALAAVALIVLLYLRLLPTGLPGQWEWQLRTEILTSWPLWITTGLVVALALAVWSYLLSAETLSRGAAVAGTALSCLLVGTMLVLMIMSEAFPPLHMASVSGSVPAMGYLGFAVQNPDPRQMLDRFAHPQSLVGQPARVCTHPPGPPLLFAFGRLAWQRLPGAQARALQAIQDTWGLTGEDIYRFSRWYMVPSTTLADLLSGMIVGTFITLLGSLMPIPAYFIGTALGGRRQGLMAAILIALLPSLVVFVPTIDGLPAVLGLATMALWLHAVGRKSWWLAALSGLAMSVAVFWTAGVAALALAMGVMAVPLRGDSAGGAREHLRSVGRLALISLGAFGAVYLALYLSTGYSLLANLRFIQMAQRSHLVFLHRSYLPWLPLNLYDTALFMGPVLVALLVGGLTRLREMPAAGRKYALGALATFLLVWASGSTLGEVGRIWLFLMALLALVPAWQLSRMTAAAALRVLSVAAVTQFALALALHCTLALVKP